MKDKLKVLYVIPTLELADGVTSYALNYYRNFEKIDVDFIITASEEKNQYYNEIIKNGSSVFFIKSNDIKHIFKSIRNIKNFFKKNKGTYDIVHCHVANTGLFYLYYAKKYDIKNRIIHSHATISADSMIHKVRNDLILPLTLKNSNINYACSQLAGEAMFKNKKFKVINNAIDINRFRYNENYRKKWRDIYSIADDEIVIGNVGRLCNQKNQLFLMDVFKKINESNKKFRLFIVGNGDLKEKIVQKIKKLDLGSYINLIESVDYINELYSMFDIFVLPSLYEGLPVVGVEAQANGLPCVFSNKITSELKINNNVNFANIHNVEDFFNTVIDCDYNCDRKNISENINKYDIKKMSKELESMYLKM